MPKSDSLPEFDSPRVNAHDVILCRQLRKQTGIRRRKLANTLHLVCLFDRVFGFDLCIYEVDGLAVFLSFVCFNYSKKKTGFC